MSVPVCVHPDVSSGGEREQERDSLSMRARDARGEESFIFLAAPVRLSRRRRSRRAFS